MPDEKLHAQVEALAREFATRVTRLVAQSIADEVEAALSRHVRPADGAPASRREREPEAPQGGRGTRTPRPARPRATSGVERWVPDRRARRVPNFVIEATGLRAKKEIVDRYGEHAIFEKGQPAPPPLRARAGGEE
jgi:hypothetical protein